MQIWNEVKNFAKIEYAKVCVNKYSLLVGPNNCGKTFLLQLIEGVNDAWNDIIDEKALKSLCTEEKEQLCIYEISERTIGNFVDILNENLKGKIDDIIFASFGKKIDIDEFKIDVTLDAGEKYYFYSSDNYSIFKEIAGDIPKLIMGESKAYYTVAKKSKPLPEEEEVLSIHASIIDDEEKWQLTAYPVAMFLGTNSIFVPASRNGLMLLYREFFAHKTDAVVSYNMNGDILKVQTKGTLNLTKFMYEFLRFLQLYKKDEAVESRNKDVIEFFDNTIINGRISVDQQNGITYTSQNENGQIPMYLTSAMVNEVVPFYLIMTSNSDYQRLVIDEIEASLHPQKQLEMVRFLNRLKNKNHQFIITTHSDTFVNGLNNLVVLSEYYNKTGDKSALDKLGVEEADLIDSSDLFVYEFVSGENGKSFVEERTYNTKQGYQFDLFTSIALKVYQDAQKLEDILAHE